MSIGEGENAHLPDAASHPSYRAMTKENSVSDDVRNIVVIGASAGGVSALQQLAADLPPQFPAVVLIVLHIGANRSQLPALLEAAGPNSAAHASDGETIRTGHLAVAPPDCHLLLEKGVLRLTRGPKENFARPAIDPLFRSAALTYGPRVIGVILTGGLDDGTAGLQAIKASGGLAVVQDPDTAFARDMPDSALKYVEVDHCVPLNSLANTLLELIKEPSATAGETNPMLRHEQAPQNGVVNAIEDLKAIGTPSALACPECGGGLWEINDANPPRYRCHTGHAYSLRSLEYAMNETTEAALWSAVRALQERAVVTRRIAVETSGSKDRPDADGTARADTDERYAADLRKLISNL
jgi:two-component system, chemotaxis family, protein-glutamate methylesterase/glutaminase